MADAPKAPRTAPAQTMATTGKGQVAKTAPTFNPPPAKATAPRSAGTTGPKIAAPSVDYHSQQGSRIPADINAPHDSSTGTYANQQMLDQQTQQVQDKGGA